VDKCNVLCQTCPGDETASAEVTRWVSIARLSRLSSGFKWQWCETSPTRDRCGICCACTFLLFIGYWLCAF